MSNRRKPYTEIGIRRCRCVRCGRQASAQWKVCADGVYRPVCGLCDVVLNKIMMEQLLVPDLERKLAEYERKPFPNR